MEQREQTRGLHCSAFPIRMAMALLMVLDHLSILGPVISLEWQAVFHALTRVVSAWFAYGAVEGLLHTRNQMRYLLRLFTWAFVMFVGNMLLGLAFSSRGVAVHNNIFLTLAVGVLMLFFLQRIKLRPLALAAALAFAVLVASFVEGGPIILPFMLISYLSYGKPKARNLAYLIFSLLLFLTAFYNYGNLHDTLLMLGHNSDFLFVLVIPLLHLYNGERGRNGSFAKYFFYVFYPLHLWLLALAGYLLVG